MVSWMAIASSWIAIRAAGCAFAPLPHEHETWRRSTWLPGFLPERDTRRIGSDESEPIVMLSGIFTAEKSFFGEYGTYGSDLVSLVWEPGGPIDFAYGFCSQFPGYPAPDHPWAHEGPIPGLPGYTPERNHTGLLERDKSRDGPGLPADPCAQLRRAGLAQRFQVSGQSFHAFAMRDADGDGVPEVWSIDEYRTVEHHSRD